MSTDGRQIYKFGDFRLDAADRELWHGDERVPLTGKAVDTLLALVERKGRLVGKDVLLAEVWPGTYVEDATLAKNISTLRKTFESFGPDHPAIETLPKRGYRFATPVEEVLLEDEITVVGHLVRTRITASHATRVGVSKTIRVIAAIGVLTAVGAIAGGLLLVRRPLPESATRFKDIDVVKLTSSGNIKQVALSPNGNFAALVESRGANNGIVLRQVNDPRTIEIVEPKAANIIGVTFSPDGAEIYYTAYDLSGSGSRIGRAFRIGALGGPAVEVAEDIDSPLAISPDGGSFAFIRRSPADGRSRLITGKLSDPASAVTLAERDIASGFLQAGLAWSPDGRRIAAAVRDASAPQESSVSPVVIDALTGTLQTFAKGSWAWIGQMSWLNDGSGLVFPAFNSGSSDHTDEIWMMSYPAGEGRQVTSGINGVYGLGVAGTADKLVTIRTERISEFWINTGTSGSRLTLRTGEFAGGESGLTWSQTGKIYFGSTLNGNTDIWTMTPSAEAEAENELTRSPGADLDPVTCGDRIIFVSNRTGRSELWQMSLDGSSESRLTDGEAVGSPSSPSDGRSVFYAAFDSGIAGPILKARPIDGGEPRIVADRLTVLPSVSPDGRFVAAYSPGTERLLKLSVIDAGSGSILKQWDTDQQAFGKIKWTPDSRRIRYIRSDGDGSVIEERQIDTGATKTVVDARPDDIFRFASSPDGTQIVYEKGKTIADVLLVSSKDRH